MVSAKPAQGAEPVQCSGAAKIKPPFEMGVDNFENETGEYVISLDVKNKDSMTDFSIGDKVAVYYDGYIAESYPMQINTVYAITLETPADRSENEVP